MVHSAVVCHSFKSFVLEISRPNDIFILHNYMRLYWPLYSILFNDNNIISGERENRRCSGRKAKASHSLAAQEGDFERVIQFLFIVKGFVSREEKETIFFDRDGQVFISGVAVIEIHREAHKKKEDKPCFFRIRQFFNLVVVECIFVCTAKSRKLIGKAVNNFVISYHAHRKKVKQISISRQTPCLKRPLPTNFFT